LPNCAVAYPLSFKISASGAAVFGQTELLPGAEVRDLGDPTHADRVVVAPVNSADRVGEHNAVVWKRLSFRPLAAKPVGHRCGARAAERAGRPEAGVVEATRSPRSAHPAGGRSGLIGAQNSRRDPCVGT